MSSFSKIYNNTFGIFKGTSKYFANNFSSFPIYIDLFGTKPGGLLSENKRKGIKYIKWANTRYCGTIRIAYAKKPRFKRVC